MDKNDACSITFSKDMDFKMEFSDEFLDASLEEQMDILKALLRDRLAAPFSAQDVSEGAAQNEITIVLLEACLGKLRLGERIEKDTNVGVFFDDLELPFNVWD
jgi:hypothetical protein